MSNTTNTPAATNTAGIDLDKLLPCPFCGGPVRIESSAMWLDLICDHDKACCLDGDSAEMSYQNAAGARDAMVSKWNRRTQQPAAPIQGASVVFSNPHGPGHDWLADRFARAAAVHDAAAPSTEQARTLAKVISYLVANNHMRWKGFEDDETFSDDNAEFQTILKLVERAIPHIDLSTSAAAKTDQALSFDEWLKGDSSYYATTSERLRAAFMAGAAAKTEQVPVLYARRFDLENISARHGVLTFPESDHAGAAGEWNVPLYLAAGAGMQECPDCDGTQRISPSELCARCDASGIVPDRAAGAGSAQPEALDERTLFEAAWRAKYSMPTAIGFSRFEDGKYAAVSISDAWDGWCMARAALTQQAGAAAPSREDAGLREAVRSITLLIENREWADVLDMDADATALWDAVDSMMVERAALVCAPLPAQGGAQPVDDARDDFARGVIAALGVLASGHGYTHGTVYHDEIVRSVGEAAIYEAAEDDDYRWAGLDPSKKPKSRNRTNDSAAERGSHG